MSDSFGPSCKTGYVEASDGYRLATRRWLPAGSPVGCVVMLHGIQSHSGWYTYSCERLAAAGFVVVFADRRGSGNNGTNRGHTPHPERLINDTVQVLQNARRATGLVPALCGLSWGGKLATAVAARRPGLLSGLVLLYPGLCTRVRPTSVQRLLLRMARRLGQGHKRVQIPLSDPALFTGDPQWQRFIDSDHRALHQVSLDFLAASLAIDQCVESAAARVSQPLLVMLAGRDRVIDNDATRELIRHFASEDRTIVEYSDACHTLEFEPNREEIVDQFIEWLRARTP